MLQGGIVARRFSQVHSHQISLKLVNIWILVIAKRKRVPFFETQCSGLCRWDLVELLYNYQVSAVRDLTSRKAACVHCSGRF